MNKPFPNKKYQIIYADPPWSYKDKKGSDKSFASAEGHYNCMQNDDIYKLPISNLINKDCVLFLWVTFPLLKEGLKCLESWGFKYKTIGFNWVKTRNNMQVDHRGIGHWTMCNSEICLIGINGKPKRIKNNIRQVIMADRKKHSQKPDEARNRIVELMGDLPRIELFARQKAKGWDCWGDEI